MYVFFFKQKTAYEMRISDWSSDVCSSDLLFAAPIRLQFIAEALVALERRHAGPFNGGNVDEAVAGAIFIRNEAIALVGVEEFYGTNRHECFLSRNMFPAGQRVQQEPGSVEGKDQLGSINFRRRRRSRVHIGGLPRKCKLRQPGGL